MINTYVQKKLCVKCWWNCMTTDVNFTNFLCSAFSFESVFCIIYILTMWIWTFLEKRNFVQKLLIICWLNALQVGCFSILTTPTSASSFTNDANQTPAKCVLSCVNAGVRFAGNISYHILVTPIFENFNSMPLKPFFQLLGWLIT